MYTSRLLYEPLGLAVTVPRLMEADMRSLDNELAAMRRYAGSREYSEWETAHRRFHRELVVHARESLARAIAMYVDRVAGTREPSRERRRWAAASTRRSSWMPSSRPTRGDHLLACHFGHTMFLLLAHFSLDRDSLEVTALLLVTVAAHTDEAAGGDDLALGLADISRAEQCDQHRDVVLAEAVAVGLIV